MLVNPAVFPKRVELSHEKDLAGEVGGALGELCKIHTKKKKKKNKKKKVRIFLQEREEDDGPDGI